MEKQDAQSEPVTDNDVAGNKKEADALADLIGKFSKDIAEHKDKFYMMDEIEFPTEISGVTGSIARPRAGAMTDVKMGAFVKVRPCAEKYDDKTFLGIYIGDIPVELIYEVEKENKMLHVRTYGNCAFFVFELSTIIFGCESWWSEVKDMEDIDRLVTDADIDNTWYVQVLKAMASVESEKETQDVDNENS